MNKYITIATINRYLKNKFDTDPNLTKVYLKGEISNYKSHTTGHLYFSLKDETSKINAVMFRSSASKLNFIPKDGTKVLVEGRISIYENTGSYQIYVEKMEEDGLGNLYLAFEKLKKKLNEKGLFDPNHKKKIPSIPSKIGVITAPTGAAVRDIIITIKRRYPIAEIILFPALVQGENASGDITNKIKIADNYDLDVLIIGRGGGSLEDLWAFNEENVAYAIYEAKTPIISAVGHEIDFTISDLVADLRAPTPTAAAELAVPNLTDLINHIKQLNIRLNEVIKKQISVNKLYLDNIKSSYVIKNPLLMFDNQKQTLDILIDKLNKNLLNKLELSKLKLNNLKKSYILNNPKELYKDEVKTLKNILDKLELLNPLNVINRGYSITYFNDNIINSIKNLKESDTIKIKLIDGTLESKVINIKEEL